MIILPSLLIWTKLLPILKKRWIKKAGTPNQGLPGTAAAKSGAAD
jgi:hypothetical protein